MIIVKLFYLYRMSLKPKVIFVPGKVAIVDVLYLKVM